jgi:beta-galactosidase
MQSNTIALFILLAAAPLSSAANSPQQQNHHFGIEGDHFALDGKPFQIISVEMHYSRVPREYWREATQGGARDGLNTVSTYVFWNMHEPKPDVFDFTGNRDLSTFIRMAQEEVLT